MLLCVYVMWRGGGRCWQTHTADGGASASTTGKGEATEVVVVEGSSVCVRLGGECSSVGRPTQRVDGRARLPQVCLRESGEVFVQ